MDGCVNRVHGWMCESCSWSGMHGTKDGTDRKERPGNLHENGDGPLDVVAGDDVTETD